MLIKSADDQSAAIQELERIAAGKGPEAKRAAEGLRKRKAGIKGESESAYLIDFEFEDARNWAVIHDLRIEHKGRVAQIDHLLINRWMDVYVLESKHFRSGVKITDDGEFLRWNEFRRTYEGMPSPLMQNERHIAVLRDVMATIDMPVRLGMRIPPTFQTFVLVAPSARIDRPQGVRHVPRGEGRPFEGSNLERHRRRQRLRSRQVGGKGRVARHDGVRGAAAG